MSDFRQAEYEALRATIRERGTMRLYAVLGGLAAWGVLAAIVLTGHAHGAVAIVPLVVLAAAFEINFFIHTGVERIGRYLQVFYEEATGSAGWETIVMGYATKYRGSADPLFSLTFSACAVTNFLAVLATSTARPGWLVVVLAAHGIFAYRIVTARKLASGQRAIDLERFRALSNRES